VVRPTPGAGRLQNRSPAHPKAKERHPGHAPPKRARDAAAFAAISGTARNHLSCLYPSEEPLSAPGFSRMVERAAIAADLGVKAHAHMLRHACGRDPSLSWASQYSEYDAAYGLGTATVQGIFSGYCHAVLARNFRECVQLVQQLRLRLLAVQVMANDVAVESAADRG
jgi:integrase